MIGNTIFNDFEEQLGRKWEVLALVVLGNGIPNYGKVVYESGKYKAFSMRRAQEKFKQNIADKYKGMKIVDVSYLSTQPMHKHNGKGNYTDVRRVFNLPGGYYPRLKDSGEARCQS